MRRSRFVESDPDAFEFGSTPIPQTRTIVVEYDTPAGRRQRRFTDAGAAKRFYTKKFESGANPTTTTEEG